MNQQYMMFLLAAVAATSSACPELQAREVESDGTVDIDIDSGPPCVVTLGVDGHRVSRVTGHGGKCNISVKDE